MSEPLDPELMAILVCPECHAPLVQIGDWLYSTDPTTRRRYPIREGIPIMLIDESEVVDEAEFARIMKPAQEKVSQ
ncbi:MAG TPA: Trm112 family protein [Phycisphaerae bacterium]|nr:Trm112 family protein [Phycisphaerae bacterium]